MEMMHHSFELLLGGWLAVSGGWLFLFNPALSMEFFKNQVLHQVKLYF